MKKEIILTKKEYNYLVEDLLKNRQEILLHIQLVCQTDAYIKILLTNDISEIIRELTEDRIGMDCFDENYEPTEEGWILEHFIDKFYVG
ncbi:hypothetical protein M2480_003083 [Parabacteroides sp. PFB2-12]|uniref:hypothetical protein n=1 Tax=unclassified Parabacteroides TaxID=2649774 RepID=UPI002474332F|nr:MULTISPECIES: hypothetical protein [unclassified Parabacteroides]MDH6344168.1 hypothetical protein [Parabacteroides sp. PM6-13]MDH6392075.1 hypothetical protein [Parabacteroides sp. PFB2-12]